VAKKQVETKDTGCRQNVQFGGYTWRVLDLQGGRALLISEYILEIRPYHDTWEPITWEHNEHSVLMSWYELNVYIKHISQCAQCL
jgi:hypothetical protein